MIKIIQMVVWDGHLYALCDEGKIYLMLNTTGDWQEIKSIPQDEPGTTKVSTVWVLSDSWKLSELRTMQLFLHHKDALAMKESMGDDAKYYNICSWEVIE